MLTSKLIINDLKQFGATKKKLPLRKNSHNMSKIHIYAKNDCKNLFSYTFIFYFL